MHTFHAGNWCWRRMQLPDRELLREFAAKSGVVQSKVAQRPGRCQEVPLCDTHSKRSSARETRSQLYLHSVKSISTIHYGKKLGDGQAQRDPLLALDTGSWVRGVRPKIAWN